MEFIIELSPSRQLAIPEELIQSFNLQPGTHFVARNESGRLIIEWLPFSSQEQAESLNNSLSNLQK